MPAEGAFTMRAVGGIVAALAVVDQSAHVLQVVVVLGDAAGNELARLSRGERRTFF
mgnify:CR=1 FL=1